MGAHLRPGYPPSRRSGSASPPHLSLIRTSRGYVFVSASYMTGHLETMFLISVDKRTTSVVSNKRQRHREDNTNMKFA